MGRGRGGVNPSPIWDGWGLCYVLVRGSTHRTHVPCVGELVVVVVLLLRIVSVIASVIVIILVGAIVTVSLLLRLPRSLSLPLL